MFICRKYAQLLTDVEGRKSFYNLTFTYLIFSIDIHCYLTYTRISKSARVIYFNYYLQHMTHLQHSHAEFGV